MYSTIFSGHPTVIKHPTPQPKGIGVNNGTAAAFALSDEATKLADQMKKGIYSVPVRLESNREEGEKDNVEHPSFVQSKENKMAEENFGTTDKNPQKFLKDSFSKDVNLMLDNLENKKDKAERIATCNL